MCYHKVRELVVAGIAFIHKVDNKFQFGYHTYKGIECRKTEILEIIDNAGWINASCTDCKVSIIYIYIIATLGRVFELRADTEKEMIQWYEIMRTVQHDLGAPWAGG